MTSSPAETTIAVVAHDAGGAEILSSYVRRKQLHVRHALAGPAVAVFERKLGAINNLSREEAVEGAEFVLCGTSSPSNFELEAVSIARQATGRVVTAAILDHWINFRRRFVTAGQLSLPDQIWVVDAAAEKMARREIPEADIKLIENPYRLDCIEQVAELRATAKQHERSALYVTEPTSEHAERIYGDARHWGYTETEAFAYFLENLVNVGPDITQVVLRPHPSENESKYAAFAASRGIRVIVRKDRDLFSEISEAAVVVGCNSMAMAIAVWAGCKVVCAIPPGGSGYALQVPGIVHLSDIVAESTLGR